MQTSVWGIHLHPYSLHPPITSSFQRPFIPCLSNSLHHIVHALKYEENNRDIQAARERHDPLVELADTGTEVLAVLEGEETASRSLAALADDAVAPPVNLNVLPLKAEEHDDAGDGNTAGEGGGQNKVVLRNKVSDQFNGEGFEEKGGLCL